MHTSVGSLATSDFAVSGTYTGGPSPVTYYVKTTNVSTTLFINGHGVITIIIIVRF